MRAYADETAVLVIDYQEKLVPAMNNKLHFLHKSAILLKGLVQLGVPMIVTQQYTKGLGETVAELRSIEGVPDAFDKITFSCLKDDSIAEALERLNVKNVIVCGCEAHICVLQTVVDLLAEEYNVYMVTDCIASRADEDKVMAIDRAKQEGAYITTCEAILFELLERAGSETFKVISRLIK
ncbi:MAG: isochorismatase family protein [Lachnospira sp.]|nr:isochorismatase family protein [Lachnospira sp.]